MEIQEILKNIMEQQQCSSVYALYILSHIQEELRSDSDVYNAQC